MMASKLFILVPAYNANATCFSLMREPVRLRYRTYNALKKWKIDLLSIQPDSISCVVMVYSGFVPSEKELSYLLKMKKNGAQPLWLKHFNMVQIKSHKFKEKCVLRLHHNHIVMTFLSYIGETYIIYFLYLRPTIFMNILNSLHKM